MCLVGALAAMALVAATGAGASSAKPPSAAPSGFRLALTGEHGGTIWTGRIPDRALPADPRSSAIYLPPHYSPRHRYPVVYLLHGMPGSPSSFVHSLRSFSVRE